MTRPWVAMAAAVLLAGCGGTVVERVHSAIDTGCQLCETIAPLCSAKHSDGLQASGVTVTVNMPAASTPPVPAPAPSASR